MNTVHGSRAALVGAVLLLVSGCAAAGGYSVTSVGPPRPLREVLPNGVVLIAQEHRASDVVAVQLWMRMGGRDEASDELGLAHYIEHMIFKGTPTHPPGSIDRLIEGFGGTSNAFTSYDATHYDFVVPAAHLPVTVELLADLAVNASFPSDAIESEKKVVFEEMNLVEDDPDKFLLRRLYEVAYSPHPYGRQILGTHEFIERLRRDPLLAVYRKYFVPKNMVVVVVGAVKPAEVRSAVAAAFGKIPSRPGGRPELPPPPAIDASRRVDVSRPEKQAYLGLAWKTAPTGNEDIYPVDLLTYILGDSPSSRLNQTVREGLRLVSSIEAGYGAWQTAGLVTVNARLDVENVTKAEAAILDVIRKVRETGGTEAERPRAIITAEASYAFDTATAEGLAKSYGQAETTWTLEDEIAYLGRLRQITAAQIQAGARRYFGDDTYARVRFVPEASQ